MQHRSTFVSFSLVLAACAGAPQQPESPATASAPAEAPRSAPQPAVPPTTPPAATTAATAAPADARELLANALRFMQSLPAMRCKAKGTFVMPELPPEIADQMEEMDFEMPTVDLEVTVALPNRFVLRATADDMPLGGGTVVCDGRQLLQSSEHLQMHSVVAAPKDLLTFFATNPDVLSVPGELNLRAILAAAGTEKALLDAKNVERLGEAKVGGRDAVHLAVRDEKLACEVWIQKGTEPWVLRHKPAPTKLRMVAAGDDGEDTMITTGDDADYELRIDFEILECSKDVAGNAFAIVEPKDSKKVEDLGAAVMAQFEEEMEDVDDVTTLAADPHPSIGKPAPDVELAMLDGTKQKLADLQGKVVVLDFWATWCGPCVQGLPKVTEVTKKLADQGVVFVAVNLGEDKATIEKFLTKELLSIPVALGDEALGKTFGVDGIPHTVVIGTDGVVKAVHVGFGPGAEVTLEKDIRAALPKTGDKKSGDK